MISVQTFIYVRHPLRTTLKRGVTPRVIPRQVPDTVLRKSLVSIAGGCCISDFAFRSDADAY